ncbi:NAD kinase-like isoform X3 [Aphis craccivora]|uniref:NAD kinase-like isoform X3 n=1 Tax=Aphis craccivora TaxID=307492 RepID=A0A6G0YJ05_APHCR|nr:NAD kinase-like isoform X3 [Aphis craccivora]
MDEGTLHMARALASMSIHEEELYSVGIKSDMTVVGKIKMQDKLQGFRYDTFLYNKIAYRPDLYTSQKNVCI